MKKVFLLAICFFCLTKITVAQSFHAGLKAGANLNKISGVPFKNKFTFGYQAGAYAAIGLTKKIGIQPEVLFSSVTADTASQFSTVYGFKKVDKIKMNYLDIPILLNVKALPFLTFQAGPQFSILFNKNKSLLQNGKDAFNKGGIGAVAGLQVNITKFKFYGRYVLGLNNLNDVNEKDKWKSRNLQIGVGYQIF